MRRDPCAVCGLPVFLAEKLLIARTPYHRTCFRCARCGNQLTPGNYYETEEGQYCCETCPDEEESSAGVHRKYTDSIMGDAGREMNEVSTRSSLSDEEKTGRKAAARNLLEKTAVPDLISHTSQMRKSFIASHLLSEKIDESTARDARNVKVESDYREGAKGRIDSAFPDDDENEEQEDEEEEDEEEEEEEEDSHSSTADSPVNVEGSNVERNDVHNALNSLEIRNKEDQRPTAISFHDVDKNNKTEDTKESSGRANTATSMSLVQRRLQMFEAHDKVSYVDKKDRNKSAFRETKGSPTVRDAMDNAQGDSWDQTPDVLRANEEECPEKRLMEETKINNEESFENVDEQRKEEKEEENSEITSHEDSFSRDIVPIKSEEHLDSNIPIEDNRIIGEGIKKQRERIEGDRAEDNEDKTIKRKSSEIVAESKLLMSADVDDYPEDLNPFKSDEEDNVMEGKRQTTRGSSSRSGKVSTNPFDSEDDEEDVEEEVTPPKPAARSSKPESRGGAPTAVSTKRLLAAPQINFHSFWSDEEEERDSDLEGRNRTGSNAPVPKPRTIKTTPEVNVMSRRGNFNREDMYASNSSLTSSESAAIAGGTYKKKKPAPQPPAAKELFPSDQQTSPLNNTLSSYHSSSPRTTPRARKTKPAPPPPMSTSTPCNMPINAAVSPSESSIIEFHGNSDDRSLEMWQDQKTNKDEMNRNRQSLSSASDDISYKSYADKSVQGKWKRKKGPAPPRPIPHRRKIKVLSMKDVKLELDEIELQQQGLEKQGVRLEQLIRDKCESRHGTEDSPLGIDVEELVLELFALVNEKNELFRRQAELMLLRRQQRLEEEHAEVEYQIRCLMCQPEATKTDFDKQREEALIQRLVEIVERRNEIVECLEMDRRREVEEDKSINKHMGLFAARNKNELFSNNNDFSNVTKMVKKGKLKEKLKEKKSKKVSKKDADKDVDETEVKSKRHNKRKWF
ncbi:FK506-binding protein 5 isoform X2 [Odontomachus brunneus]|nr:FK506-binding protein 5 isoform X2 [Odontomachus brunneus]XP_032667704.1 FK506-binding protein 5 isoform X2 [Odontomachus brunneus]